MEGQILAEYVIFPDDLKDFIYRVLLKNNTREDVAEDVAGGIVHASVRGVDSHGIRLFPHYLAELDEGRINPNPKYEIKKTSASTALFDADHTFGHAGCMAAVRYLIELASEAGAGHIAVYNSNHFGAASYYGIEIAKHNMIGLCLTNTDSLLKTYAGKEAFLGNNPICITAPCEEEEPFCLDMATSFLTFNKITQLREEGKSIPSGVCADKEGVVTDEIDKMKMLLPIGGYKGYGLSLAFEIFCSLLTGMPYGPYIPKMFEPPLSQRRYISHFLIALKIDCFQDIKIFKKRLRQMLDELRQGKQEEDNVCIQVPGDPEKRIAEQRRKRGIPLKDQVYNQLREIGENFGIDLVIEEIAVK